MNIICSTTTQLPSETANSIQAVMACEGLRRCGENIRLYVPGSGEIAFEQVKEHYDMHCEPFPVRYVRSVPHLHRMDFTLSVLSAGKGIPAPLHYTWTIQLAAAAAIRGLETAYEIHDLPTGGGIRWFELYTRTKAPKKVICITKALRDRLLAQFPHLKEEDCDLHHQSAAGSSVGTIPASERRRLPDHAERVFPGGLCGTAGPCRGKTGNGLFA